VTNALDLRAQPVRDARNGADVLDAHRADRSTSADAPAAAAMTSGQASSQRLARRQALNVLRSTAGTGR
jgi:hypothetical protein